MLADREPDQAWSVQYVVNSLDDREFFNAALSTAPAVLEMPPCYAEHLLIGVGAWAE